MRIFDSRLLLFEMATSMFRQFVKLVHHALSKLGPEMPLLVIRSMAFPVAVERFFLLLLSAGLCPLDLSCKTEERRANVNGVLHARCVIRTSIIRGSAHQIHLLWPLVRSTAKTPHRLHISKFSNLITPSLAQGFWLGPVEGSVDGSSRAHAAQ